MHVVVLDSNVRISSSSADDTPGPTVNALVALLLIGTTVADVILLLLCILLSLDWPRASACTSPGLAPRRRPNTTRLGELINSNRLSIGLLLLLLLSMLALALSVTLEVA
jgi:hypothetical protein